MITKRCTVVDLFCGAGGLSFGFKSVGWDVIYAIDNDPAAIETHRYNLGSHAACESITHTTEIPDADVIIGGPPCQGFSSAGPRKVGDERNSLVSVFASLIVQHKPYAFIFENVEGFLTAENGRRVLDLLEPLIEAGYRIHLRKINVANYGVPQHRKRTIAIGGLGWEPSFPEPTHRAYGAPGASLIGRRLPRTTSVREALAGLPYPTTNPPGTPSEHYSRPLSQSDRVRICALEPGGRMRDLPESLWHESYRRRAFRRVMDGTPTERRGGAPAGIRRLIADEPSKAITGVARTEFIHPEENRFLTTRECARIQTFPDHFLFCGSATEKASQVGNAVPPHFSAVLGESLLEDLSVHQSRVAEGGLLSFIPTTSNGMSPALQAVVRLIVERFQVPELETADALLWD